MILNSKICGHGSPLIILHGLFGSLDNWWTIAKILSSNYEVHILDQRNHGKSFHHPSHNYNDMAFDLHQYIRHHNLYQPNILGHSMGGKTAMMYALDYPNAFNKLLVIDIAPKKYGNTHHALVSLLMQINKKVINSRKQVERILIKNHIDMNTTKFLLKNLYWFNDIELKFRFNIEAIYNSIDHLMLFNPLGSSDRDVYFIKGENSNYILESDLTLIQDFFPNNQLITINQSGHWVHFDQRDIFVETIKNILK